MLASFPLLILILYISDNTTPASCLNDEGVALLSFKHFIKHDPDASLNNWNYSDETPCSWNGITCKQQRVVSISIPNKKLSGLLSSSSSLRSLSELRHVNLRSNNFSGELPSDLFTARGLQSLVLYGNSFSGPLPFEIGNLKYLQTLNVAHNFLNGSLPLSLIHCKKLKNIDLSGNNFSGSLPDGFGENLVFLEKLDLSYNGFGGLIPSDLGYLSSLRETIDLSHNSFTGPIPASLGNLPEKVYIDLTYNKLTGPIPQNGALVNRGPTAFIGNPNLCGPPLKNLCSFNSTEEANSPSPFPYLPGNNYDREKVGNGGGGLSKASITAIVVSDVIGVCVIGLLFSYCCSCLKKKYGGFEKRGKSGNKREFSCFRKEYESDDLSESNEEQYGLVALDEHVAFDLEELLKASAFVLGKSGIGIVYKVVLEGGPTLAVRRLGEGGSQRFKEFRTEVEAIGKIRHRNIATLRAYYWSLDEKLLIYDFVPNGNLSNAIHGKFNLLWSARLKIMKGVAKGLVYLHDYSPKKYVHGDLKPSNILLGEKMEPKISDFGLGRLATIAGSVSEIPILPPASSSNSISCYRAPEAAKGAKPSQKWDVYSYGVILLEIISGRSPLDRVGNSEMDIVRWIGMCIDDKKPIFDVWDPQLVRELDKEKEIVGVLKIALACTERSPERRPSMRGVFDALDKLTPSM
ncbi:hypothetical protein ABFS83_05G037400 [Erythranthe nasuta]